jgi:hypothetical protein
VNAQPVVAGIHAIDALVAGRSEIADIPAELVQMLDVSVERPVLGFRVGVGWHDGKEQCLRPDTELRGVEHRDDPHKTLHPRSLVASRSFWHAAPPIGCRSDAKRSPLV